jgi:tRNA(Ile)-lysidine synthase TilS/MesJ
VNAESYASWKNVYGDFLKSGTSKEGYCQEKGLPLKWFERQCRKAKTYERRFLAEEQKPPENLKDLFIELVPEKAEQQRQEAVPLKLMYREVAFELCGNFEDGTFKRALCAIRETL